MKRKGGPGWYHCRYRVTDHLDSGRKEQLTYGSYVWAPSYAEARRRVIQRNIGEEVSSPYPFKSKPHSLPSELLSAKRVRWTKVQHAVCWLGWLAVKQGIRSVDQLLSDTGLLHELAHRADLNSGPSKRELAQALRRLEREVVGFAPADW